MTIPVIVRPPNAPAKKPNNDSLERDAIPYEIGIIRQFPFSSTLQRMSVIARALNGTHFSVYTKGSPEMIESLCRQETLPRDFHKTLMEYTCEGYRVIALAWRPLRVAYTRVMRLQRDSIERQLNFLGLLVMENRLKPESAPAIKLLKQACIKPVMVTGDNMLTALSVARDCEMIDETDRIIIVSAKPPILRPETPPDSGAGIPGVPNSLDNQGGAEETWVNLVQFHYAEDLHRPVTEVTATTTLTTSRDGRRRRYSKEQHQKPTIQEMKLDRGHKQSRLSKCLPFSHRRNQSINCDGMDIEAGPRATGDDRASFTTATIANGKPPFRVGQQVRSRGRVKPRYPNTTSISLRMVDRPDFHLALSGKTWAIIREHFSTLIPKLVVKGTVFARFSPEQKTQLIESLQSVGYFVAMCGDGANDCGALKAAHAGVGLSQAEASVASPFTATEQNISCILRLIREGRCALATSFGTFKFMMGYSVTQFTSVLILYWVKSNLFDMQFLYIDLFLITSLGITFCYTKAYPRLSADPPVMRLLSSTTLLSLGSQLVLVITTQIGVFLYLRAQPWYIDYCGINMEEYQFQNLDNTAVFMVSMFQYIFLAVIFSSGPPYRRRLYTNFLFLGNVLIAFGMNFLLVFIDAEPLMNRISIISFPTNIMGVIIVLAAFVNFFLGFLVEVILDGVAFRHHMHHLKKVLFPRYVARKDYERIREEIDRMVGVWPPIIRSASIQDIPVEFFSEETGDGAGRNRSCSSDRSRRTSTITSCRDDETQKLEEWPVTGISTAADAHNASAAAVQRRLRCESRGRCRSLGASDLRDLMEKCEAENNMTRKLTAQETNEDKSSPNLEKEEAILGVRDKGELHRLQHVYPSRMRSKSSSCDKQVPSEVDKTRVLPLRNPGLS